jgi:glycosyltransferase involved in cell wall biosynthesis
MSRKDQHIALYLPNLNGGGAQRIMVTLANEFAKQGMRTDLVVVKYEGPFCKHLLPDVNVFNLESSRALTSLPGLIGYLRQQRPSGLLATLAGTNVVAALAHWLSSSNATLVLRETNPVKTASNRYASLKGKIIHLAAFWAYRYSNYVVGISKGLSEDVATVFNVPSDKVVTIYNPAVTDEQLDPINSGKCGIEEGSPIVLGAGRLVKEKGFDTLIRAFARIRLKCSARLYILGEGHERSSLERLAHTLGLQDDVHMPGFVDNPFAYMQTADVFVLSSRWEGFGNVLVEAMACGTQVVSTDCPSGPTEILEGGKWGKLVPVGDSEAMAEAIFSTLEGERNIDELDVKARVQDFHVQKISTQYLELLLG